MTNIHFHNAGAAIGVGYNTCNPPSERHTGTTLKREGDVRLCALQFESGFRDARLSRLATGPAGRTAGVSYDVSVHKKESDWHVSLGGLAAPFKFSPLLAAETQASTKTPECPPAEPRCSASRVSFLTDARLGAPAGDRPISDSKLCRNGIGCGATRHALSGLGRGQLTDAAPKQIPNNLGRYLVQRGQILRTRKTARLLHQSYLRHAVIPKRDQVSGSVDRETKELVTNANRPRRRAWYTMTHHASLACKSRRYGTPSEKMRRRCCHLMLRRLRASLIAMNRRSVDFLQTNSRRPHLYSDQDLRSSALPLVNIPEWSSQTSSVLPSASRSA